MGNGSWVSRGEYEYYDPVNERKPKHKVEFRKRNIKERNKPKHNGAANYGETKGIKIYHPNIQIC